MTRTSTGGDEDAAEQHRSSGEQASVRQESESGERDAPSPEPAARAERHLEDEAWDYLNGGCSEARLAEIDAHLDTCEACRELIHHLLQALADTGPQPAPRDLSEAFMSFLPDSLVNSRFLIRRFVGRGGMGEVYEAIDRLTNTRIALKTVLCSVEDRPRATRRLIGEVLHAQRVGHAHVCRINEFHEHSDGTVRPPIPFFTMEFVDGVRLSQRIRKSTLLLAETQIIARQVLSGLAAAHSRAVLHLDLKSDNVMLRAGTAEPYAVIMDFGLSRLLEKESKLHTSERHQLVGTLPYMSLEQLECRDNLGPPADIYSFGVVLYEMLTGGFPFCGDSVRALLIGQLETRPAPPSTRVPGLTPALDRFVLQCLAREPELRYADAGEALNALDRIGPWATPVSSGVSSVRRRVAALVASVLLVTALAFAARQRDSSRSTYSEFLRPTASAAPNTTPPMARGAASTPSSGAAATGGGSGIAVTPHAEPRASAPAASAPADPTPNKRREGARRPAPAGHAPKPATSSQSGAAPGAPALSVEAPPSEAPDADAAWPAGVPRRLLSRPAPREQN